MSAPAQEGMVGELLRVCRPGGRIGLVSWTPDGYLGHLFTALGRRLLAPAAGKVPILCGTKEQLRELFGPEVAITAPQRSFLWRFPSAEHQVEFFVNFHAPTVSALQALGPDGVSALKAELLGSGQALRRVRGRHVGAAARLPGGRGPQADVAVASDPWTQISRWSTGPICR
jgi:hypothetical protein